MNNSTVATIAATLTFGVEIELLGLNTKRAAEVIAAHFGTQVIQNGGYYNKWSAVDGLGRSWVAMTDSSLLDSNSAEVVTPVLCGEADILMLQEVVRVLRRAGARVDEKCGLHVHVGASGLTRVKHFQNLVRLMAKYEDVLDKGLAVLENRKRYCMQLDAALLDRLDAVSDGEISNPTHHTELAKAWYGDAYSQYSMTQHYDGSRYRTLNLHAFFFNKKTVEFRLFNGTLHAGKVRAAVQFATHMVARAMGSKTAKAAYPITLTGEAKAHRVKWKHIHFKNMLDNLGLADAAHATARLHLGDAVFNRRVLAVAGAAE